MDKKTEKIILSLGGNIGNVPQTFEKAFELLTLGRVKILGKSEIIKTVPVDCPVGTDDFYNMAIFCESSLAPLELLDLCQKIEVTLGRPADHGFHLSRTIDIDIVAIGNQKLDLPRLTIPHKEAKNRDFVMIPFKNLKAQKLFSDEEFKVLCEKI